MLASMRMTIVADSIVDENRIASFGAVLNLDDMEVSLTNRYIDKEACKTHRDLVRKDQAAFEDMVYDLQDRMKK